MKSLHPFSLSACLLAGVLFSMVPSVSAAQRVPSERSKAASVQVAPTWRAASFPAAQVSRLQYREMPISRILKVEQYNSMRRTKLTQIGIGRVASSEGTARALAALKWMAMRDGSSVARIEIASPVALGLRVGLDVSGLDSRAELRFAGSDEPFRVIAMITGSELRKLADLHNVAWTPATDGERQIIEVYLPAGVPRSAVKLQAPELSHLLTNSRNDFKIIQKIGESGTCNVDTACRVGELGANFVSAKNAVVHMVFTWFDKPNPNYPAPGQPQFLTGSFICTGTLLADSVAESQIPYFYSANHCFEGRDDGFPAQDKQRVANSLLTYWKYEASGCRSGVEAAKVQLVGGADYLYSDPDTGATTINGTDGLLLRLNNTPPSGAEFAGWDSAPLASSSNIIGIHHPMGDVKKVSSGKQVSVGTYQNVVAWLSGTTEGGSSGSGLFTADASGYHLRGGLYGGSALCSNSGSTANTDNRDYYSRFDVVFPHIGQWLAPAPPTRIRVNGSQPRIPGMSAATVPAAATLPAGKTSPWIPARTRIYEP